MTLEGDSGDNSDEDDVQDQLLLDQDLSDFEDDSEERGEAEDLKIKDESPDDYQATRPRRPRSQISNDIKTTQCPECGAEFTSKGNMMAHYRSKHELIKYPCYLCDYQATQQSSLQKHIQAVHEGIKYPCNQCDYQATHKHHLKSHISAKHSDTVLKCEDCEYQTKWRSNFQTHKKTHKSVTN